jgi:hypothetical protein
MVGDIPIRWNSTYDMILRAKRIHFPLRDWLDEQILNDPSQERLSLSNIIKLKEYYSKTGGPVETQYALAAMLNPSQKLNIFAGPGWGRSFFRKYTKEFVDHWSDNYQTLAMMGDDQPRASMAPQTLNGIF